MNKLILLSAWLAFTAVGFSQTKIVYTDKLPSGLKSVDKEGEVEVVFKNKSQDFITVFWVDANGDIPIGSTQYIAPGNRGCSGKTAVGRAHVIMTITGKILGYLVFEDAGKFELVIEPTKINNGKSKR
jgi:hypothetical protein